LAQNGESAKAASLRGNPKRGRRFALPPHSIAAGFCALICSGWLQHACAQSPTNQFHFSDYLLVPLKVHFLLATNAPAIQTTLTETDFDRILGKMNRVWSQAGLHFFIQSIQHEHVHDPGRWAGREQPVDGSELLELRPRASLSTNTFHIYYVKTMSVNGIYFSEGIFVKDTASLRKVEGGIDEPLPRVTSHELGHALGLSHRQNTTNLMASGTTGTWLNAEEIHQARQKAKGFDWVVPAPQVINQANDLFREKKFPEAKRLYSRVADISSGAEEEELARKRIADIGTGR